MPKHYVVCIRHPIIHYEAGGGAYLCIELGWRQMVRAAFSERLETNLIQYA